MHCWVSDAEVLDIAKEPIYQGYGAIETVGSH
jgi:hypothetical protein